MKSLVALPVLLTLAGCGAIAPLDLTANDAKRAHLVEDSVPVGDDGVVRFFAVGDAGIRNGAHGIGASTRAVADLVHQTCESKQGCDFGVFLGDNLYDAGVDSDDDVAFLEAFVRLYAGPEHTPLYFVLGNHDWHSTSPSTKRAARELQEIEKLHPLGARGRAHFFDFTSGPVELFAWDTNYLVHRCEDWPGAPLTCGLHGKEMLGRIGASPSPFRVWLGHHPFVSNGGHGDAGSYLDGGMSLMPGEGLRRLFETHVVGKADLLLSGHDHNLQVFMSEALQGSAAVVSGAGGRTTPLRAESLREPSAYERDHCFGFVLVEATQETLTVEVYAIAERPEERPHSSREPAFRMCKTVGGAWRPGACPSTSAGNQASDHASRTDLPESAF